MKITRRDFLTAFLAGFVAAAVVDKLQNIPQPPTEPQVMGITVVKPTTVIVQPCPNRLPECPSRRQIHAADLQTVLNWWGQYGAGVQAWRYRGVPRAAVREWLFYRWEIVANEHIYG